MSCPESRNCLANRPSTQHHDAHCISSCSARSHWHSKEGLCSSQGHFSQPLESDQSWFPAKRICNQLISMRFNPPLLQLDKGDICDRHRNRAEARPRKVPDRRHSLRGRIHTSTVYPRRLSPATRCPRTTSSHVAAWGGFQTTEIVLAWPDRREVSVLQNC